jgi:hypothetical protein
MPKSEEEVMGWYYYLDDKVRFTLEAKRLTPKIVSPMRKQAVEIQPMEPERARSAAIGIGPCWVAQVALSDTVRQASIPVAP